MFIASIIARKSLFSVADTSAAVMTRPHGCPSHSSDCEWLGHALPPNSGAAARARWRVLTPPPHVFEHDDQSAQRPVVQSFGHPCVLHEVCAMFVSPVHCVDHSDVAVRARLATPVPQLTGHADQLPHALTVQPRAALSASSSAWTVFSR